MNNGFLKRVLAALVLAFAFLTIYEVQLNKRLDILESQFSELEKINEKTDYLLNVKRTLPADYVESVEILFNKNIEEVLDREHLAGGKWLVDELVFLSPDVIRLVYADGHETGSLLLKVFSVKSEEIKYQIIYE